MSAMVGAGAIDEQILQLSGSARRLLRRPRPRWRGVLHRWAALVWLAAGVTMSILAEGQRATIALGLFSLGAVCTFAVSALVHGRDWGIHQVETLVRLDHSTIFLMFATSGTPIAVLGLERPISTWFLVVLWSGALVGVVAEWLPVHPPLGVMNTAYLTFGWGMAGFLPWLLTGLAARQIALLFAGGLAYTAGAIIVGVRRPDPWPESFGYHEVWHVLVILAAAAHTTLAVDLAGL